MEIEDKYLNLLGTYIYDKRRKMHGMLSELSIRGFSRKAIHYKAYMCQIYNSVTVFVEDFKKGDVVFLMPFDIEHFEKEMEEVETRQRKNIKEFFGDDFREDMIIRVPENERQKQIKEWGKCLASLENWRKVDMSFIEF